mgnify:CR=1 FL=1
MTESLPATILGAAAFQMLRLNPRREIESACMSRGASGWVGDAGESCLRKRTHPARRRQRTGARARSAPRARRTPSSRSTLLLRHLLQAQGRRPAAWAAPCSCGACERRTGRCRARGGRRGTRARGRGAAARSARSGCCERGKIRTRIRERRCERLDALLVVVRAPDRHRVVPPAEHRPHAAVHEPLDVGDGALDAVHGSGRRTTGRRRDDEPGDVVEVGVRDGEAAAGRREEGYVSFL